MPTLEGCIFNFIKAVTSNKTPYDNVEAVRTIQTYGMIYVIFIVRIVLRFFRVNNNVACRVSMTLSYIR